MPVACFEVTRDRGRRVERSPSAPRGAQGRHPPGFRCVPPGAPCAGVETRANVGMERAFAVLRVASGASTVRPVLHAASTAEPASPSAAARIRNKPRRLTHLAILAVVLAACSRRTDDPAVAKREAAGTVPSGTAAAAPQAPDSKEAEVGASVNAQESGEAAAPRGEEACVEEKSGAVTDLATAVERAPSAPGADRRAVSDLANLAWAFYAQANHAEKNFVYSPYSIAVASAMLSAGAAGRTLSQLRSALRFSQLGEPLHESHNALAELLRTRNQPGNKQRHPQLLRISNDIWIHREARPNTAFINTLARQYGAVAHLAAFGERPDESRRTINYKVCKDTLGMVPELLPTGSIDSNVRLVLTNALYLRARWQNEFPKSDTAPRPFFILSGETVQVRTMRRRLNAGYGATDGYVAVSLPYSGQELDMVFVMPRAGSFPSFVRSMSAARMTEMLSKIRPQFLDLALPKFEIDTAVPLKPELIRAGMVEAFTPGAANFPLIGAGVFVSEAVHKARLALDEEGTEAAAATAYAVKRLSAPREPTPIEVKLDRPFIFFIRDRSGAVLFVGHVLVPR